MHALVAVIVNGEGHREVLGLDVSAQEAAPGPDPAIHAVDPAGADKSSAQVTSLIIDPGLSAAMPLAPALFTSAADWRAS